MLTESLIAVYGYVHVGNSPCYLTDDAFRAEVEIAKSHDSMYDRGIKNVRHVGYMFVENDCLEVYGFNYKTDSGLIKERFYGIVSND